MQMMWCVCICYSGKFGACGYCSTVVVCCKGAVKKNEQDVLAMWQKQELELELVLVHAENSFFPFHFSF